MKCKTCNGLGRVKATEFVGVDEGLREVVILCSTCGGKGEVESLTEQEYIQTFDTEQLAKWLDNLLMRCLCGDCNFCPINKQPHCTCESIEEWLKQPHTAK